MKSNRRAQARTIALVAGIALAASGCQLHNYSGQNWLHATTARPAASPSSAVPSADQNPSYNGEPCTPLGCEGPGDVVNALVYDTVDGINILVGCTRTGRVEAARNGLTIVETCP